MVSNNYKKIIKLYNEGKIISQIAKELQVTETRVRRVLITEGLWKNKTTEAITDLYYEGYFPPEIAQKLGKSLKTIQAYMPYSRGEYLGDSKDSQWSKDYRKKKSYSEDHQAYVSKEDTQNAEEKYYNPQRINTKVFHLHLEIPKDWEDAEEEALAKYGSVTRSLSRDVFVPADMPLHNLHYLIQKAFGWQNSHRHSFSYSEAVFRGLTKENLSQWLNCCGLYLRFPSNQIEEISWDDDYSSIMSISTWLRSKYVGPYTYGGLVENYLYDQARAKEYRLNNPMIRIGASFQEYMEGNETTEIKKIEDIRIDEMRSRFDAPMDHLLERLTVEQVLGIRETQDWETKVQRMIQRAEETFREDYLEAKRISKEGKEKKLRKFFYDTNPVTIPLSDTIYYTYSAKTPWQVEITCMNVYEMKNEISWLSKQSKYDTKYLQTEREKYENQLYIDAEGRVVNGEIRVQIIDVLSQKKPLCVSLDGLPLLEDVVGMEGYCDFLRGLHGEIKGNKEFHDKEKTKEWGKLRGWTGKMSRPEKML